MSACLFGALVPQPILNPSVRVRIRVRSVWRRRGRGVPHGPLRGRLRQPAAAVPKGERRGLQQARAGTREEKPCACWRHSDFLLPCLRLRVCAAWGRLCGAVQNKKAQALTRCFDLCFLPCPLPLTPQCAHRPRPAKPRPQLGRAGGVPQGGLGDAFAGPRLEKRGGLRRADGRPKLRRGRAVRRRRRRRRGRQPAGRERRRRAARRRGRRGARGGFGSPRCD